jgi:hypothetical protein
MKALFCVHTMQQYGGRRGLAVLILYLCARQRRVVNLAHQPLYRTGKSSDFHWAEGRLGTRPHLNGQRREKLVLPTGIRFRAIHPPAPSLSWLHPLKRVSQKFHPLSSFIFILPNIKHCSPNDTVSRLQKTWNFRNTDVRTSTCMEYLPSLLLKMACGLYYISKLSI